MFVDASDVRTPHIPDWVWDEDDQFWWDWNQPDSDQTGGASLEDWVAILAGEGIVPPLLPPGDVSLTGVL